MPWVGPGREARHDVELTKQATDHLVGLGFGAKALELSHDAGQSDLDVTDGAFGIELALRVKATLTLEEFFPIEI